MSTWHDAKRLRLEAAENREVGRRMSLRHDRERLLKKAAELDATATWLECEKTASGCIPLAAECRQRPRTA
jgi:hypothetical protein